MILCIAGNSVHGPVSANSDDAPTGRNCPLGIPLITVRLRWRVIPTVHSRVLVVIHWSRNKVPTGGRVSIGLCRGYCSLVSGQPTYEGTGYR